MLRTRVIAGIAESWNHRSLPGLRQIRQHRAHRVLIRWLSSSREKNDEVLYMIHAPHILRGAMDSRGLSEPSMTPRLGSWKVFSSYAWIASRTRGYCLSGSRA